jgi:hypothetical protein
MNSCQVFYKGFLEKIPNAGSLSRLKSGAISARTRAIAIIGAVYSEAL